MGRTFQIQYEATEKRRDRHESWHLRGFTILALGSSRKGIDHRDTTAPPAAPGDHQRRPHPARPARPARDPARSAGAERDSPWPVPFRILHQPPSRPGTGSQRPTAGPRYWARVAEVAAEIKEHYSHGRTDAS